MKEPGCKCWGGKHRVFGVVLGLGLGVFQELWGQRERSLNFKEICTKCVIPSDGEI